MEAEQDQSWPQDLADLTMHPRVRFPLIGPGRHAPLKRAPYRSLQPRPSARNSSRTRADPPHGGVPRHQRCGVIWAPPAARPRECLGLFCVYRAVCWSLGCG